MRWLRGGGGETSCEISNHSTGYVKIQFSLSGSGGGGMGSCEIVRV